MALVGVELETLVFEPDAQTTRPPMHFVVFGSNSDFLFIYMKLKNLEKQANYILDYIYRKKKRKHKRALKYCFIK